MKSSWVIANNRQETIQDSNDNERKQYVKFNESLTHESGPDVENDWENLFIFTAALKLKLFLIIWGF